jgi:glucose-6-phosphate isomerase
MSMDDLKSLSIPFAVSTGLSPAREATKRHLSKMRGMYADADAFATMLGDDPLVYEFYEMGIPEKDGEIAFGTSITYPGKVGAEYFMTKGHFHTILDTAEVYYCLSGTGVMLMENPEGDWEARELTPGTALYVPGRYAHRSINTGTDGPLVTFFAFRADAGHDYGTIETKGFRKLVVERDGAPTVIDNPKWGAS